MSIGKVIGYVLRFLFAWIDGIVAKVITEIYNLLINLSSIILYSDSIVKTIGRRVGLLLGVFMLFRLAISLINYMISPDKIKDGSKGGGKLVVNVVISLVLLATVNIIFETAYKVQIKVIDSRIIEKIFFGESSSKDMDIGYYLYNGFFRPNPEVFTQNECDNIWDNTVKLTGTNCYSKLENDLKLDGDARDAIILARNKMQMSHVFSKYKLVLAMDGLNDEFVFNYTPILSTAAGIIVLLVLISFSMELATRAIRLLFLQIIAPIPIIFNMDLGKGKDVFQKWYKDCFSTYLSVFLRLLAINFVVFMIVLLNGNYKDIFSNNWLLNVFLIIGALIFAKRVPKLLEDMLGIKMDGMSLKPLKKFQEQALFGKQITGLAGAGVASVAAFGANTLATEGNIFKRLGSGIGGATSAALRGTAGALKGQKFGDVYKGAYKGAIIARNNRDSRQKLDVSTPSMWLNSWQRRIGMDTTAESQDADLKVYEEFSSSADALVSLSESEVQKYATKIRLNNDTRISQVDLNEDSNPYAGILREAKITSQTFETLGALREAISDTMRYDAQTRAALNSEYERIKGQAEDAYREIAKGGSKKLHESSEFSMIDETDTSGLTAQAHIKNLNEIYSTNSSKDGFAEVDPTVGVTGANAKKVNKRVKLEATNIKNSDAYRQAHKVQEQTNREKK